MRALAVLTASLFAVGLVSACVDTPNGPTPTPTPTATPTLTPTAPPPPTNGLSLSVLIEPPDSGSVEVQRFGIFTTESLVRLEQVEPVNVIARPNRGWRFKHWRGALSGDQFTQPLAMDASKQVTAVFERQQPPGEITVVGTVTRPAQHNVIDLDGNNNLETYETGEDLPGLYLSMDLDRLGDFLQLFSDETFYLEEYQVGYSGRWELNGNEIVLKISAANP